MGRAGFKLGGHDPQVDLQDMPPRLVSSGRLTVSLSWRPFSLNRVTRAPYGAHWPQTWWPGSLRGCESVRTCQSVLAGKVHPEFFPLY
jgi:hypothetical protein